MVIVTTANSVPWLPPCMSGSPLHQDVTGPHHLTFFKQSGELSGRVKVLMVALAPKVEL